MRRLSSVVNPAGHYFLNTSAIFAASIMYVFIRLLLAMAIPMKLPSRSMIGAPQ